MEAAQFCLYVCIFLKSRQPPACSTLSWAMLNPRPEALHTVKLGCQWNDPMNLEKIRLGDSLSHCEKVTGLIHISFRASPVMPREKH